MGLTRKIITSTLGRKFAIFASEILSEINKILPKSKKKIMFYDPSNEFLTDNSKALYNYLVEKKLNEKYKIICCVSNVKSISKVRNVKIVGFYRGIFHYLTSKYIFYSFGSMRIKSAKQQIIINLTHGTPLKALGSFELNKRYGKEELNDFTYIIATSEYYKKIISKAFKCPLEKVIVQGHARNDYLFSEKSLPELVNTNYAKKILWMPTFRMLKGRYNDLGKSINTETALPLIETFSELEELNNYLLDMNILLVIKTHPGAEFNTINYSNIKLYTNEDIENKHIELYEFIKEFDALLTDYSSIFFDYLLLDRPIGFTIDDYELYSQNRGFSVKNPLSHMPGHHIKSITELKEYFHDVIHDNDLFKDQRYKVNAEVNFYKDNKNRERLFNYLGIF